MLVAGARAVVAVALATTVVAAAARVTVPSTLPDVAGAEIDVAGLAQRSRLVFVTIKAAGCPVCRMQLQRLEHLLPRFQACGASFVVLVPGTNDVVAALARATRFPYPFVADDAAAVAAATGFAGDPGQLVPGFFAVNGAREVVWTQRGRADGAFGDDELLTYLGCPPARDLLASTR